MSDRLRAEAMSRRLLRTASGLGLAPVDQELIARAFQVAMVPRFAAGLEDHHPDYLHPARTALILMDDARIADPRVLAAALLTESRDPAFLPDLADVPVLDDAAALAAAIPDPSRPDLVEALVIAPVAVRLVAVAERLDHARHLHLRDAAEWRPYHHLTRSAYAPAAERTHPALAGRLAWWCATFEERFLSR